MIILTKKVFCFVKQDSVVREDAVRFTTKGGMAIEDVPEWVKNDPLYGWGLEDGDIVEVNNASAKSESIAVAKAKKRRKAKTEDVAPEVETVSEAEDESAE